MFSETKQVAELRVRIIPFPKRSDNDSLCLSRKNPGMRTVVSPEGWGWWGVGGATRNDVQHAHLLLLFISYNKCILLLKWLKKKIKWFSKSWHQHWQSVRKTLRDKPWWDISVYTETPAYSRPGVDRLFSEMGQRANIVSYLGHRVAVASVQVCCLQLKCSRMSLWPGTNKTLFLDTGILYNLSVSWNILFFWFFSNLLKM